MNPQCSAAIINFSYQTQAVRDLAWACFAPPLLHIADATWGTAAPATTAISACSLTPTASRLDWLQRLDHDPAPLLEHLSKRPSHRLGVYFELLWHFFLQRDPDIELVAHNLPIHDNGGTLGEFDCIYYDRVRARHVHLELAVKYFLGVPRGGDTTTPATAYEWLGPDQRDRLATKLEQLLQRQILLADTAAAKAVLAQRGLGELAREIALKGYLFQPPVDAPPPPPSYNSECTMSRWVTAQQLDACCATLAAACYTVLPKMCWLSPVYCAPPDQRLDRQQLRQRLHALWRSDHYPALVAALDREGTETSRFFVTPGTWPDPVSRDDK